MRVVLFKIERKESPLWGDASMQTSKGSNEPHTATGERARRRHGKWQDLGGNELVKCEQLREGHGTRAWCVRE